MSAVTRRAVLRSGVLGSAASVACARAATPAPVQESAPTRSALPPAPVPSAQTRPESDWGEVVTAAQREGKLSLITLVNRGWADVIEHFERTFPGITVERFAESSASVWLDALRRARGAGSQSFDLAFVQPAPALGEKMWAPLKPLLFHPDVVAGGAWRDGLDGRFLDTGGQLCFDWEFQVHHAYAVKTHLVREGEITSVTDLLDPKWRGKVMSSDPRTGNALTSATSVAQRHGRDVLRRLLVDQRPTMIPTDGWSPERAEAFIRSSYPIAQGLRPKPLAQARAKGIAGNVAFLDLPDADFVPSTAMLHVEGAPHPAAARLFANWILTRDGQSLLTSSLPTNSARTDVPPSEPDGIGAPTNTYYDPDREANKTHAAETARFVQDLLRTAR
jgi:iron(III) transport system substrate-binding protein